ncbi:MAG: hypothetical protein KJN92_00655 [Gemmatimonadetes bacterium]|nr:hypothetical protein [Gemmatimonadota bacterium]
MSPSPTLRQQGVVLPLTLFFFLLLGILLTPDAGAAQGLTYNLSPSAKWIEWDEELGFQQSRLWGGSVGMGFGRYVGLQAFHYQDDKLELFEDPGEGEPAPKLFDLSQSGLQVSFSLGSGRIVPVLVGGGSLLTFKPRDGDELKKLSLDYGAGLKVVLGESLHGEVIVESTQYRLDPALLGTGEPGFEGTGPLRRNMALRASLGLQLGRRSFNQADELDDAFAQRYQAPFANFALAVEPLLGRLDYDKAIDLDNQEMAGVRAGFDFGSFFGFRGFHWWGTESDFRSTTDFRAWGGEAQFNLASGPGLNPYLTAGAGQLSWGKAKEDEPARPDDQTALILGGGVDFNFGPRIRATVAARDFVLAGSDLSASPELSTISDPDELIHNWQFSAGLKFLIGRTGVRSGRPEEPRSMDDPATDLARAATEPVTVAEAEAPVEPAPDQPSVVAVQPDPQPQPAQVAGAGVAVPTQPGQAVTVSVDTVVIRESPANTIVLPVLEKGEIYIRFGEPGSRPLITTVRAETEGPPATVETMVQTGPTLEEIRELIQEELGKQTEREQQALDREALEELEIRLQRRLDEIERAAMRAEEAARLPAPVTVAPAPEVAVISQEAEASPTPGMERRVEELRPYGGFNLTNNFQFVVGMGLDIGSLKPGSKLHLVPQAAIGFGQGPSSFLISADVEYRFPTIDAGARAVFEPMVSVGPGLIKRDDMELQLGTFLGTGLRIFERNGAVRFNLFGGIQGIDFFDDTRFIVGLRRLR